jgi:signal transduction histidine kinase
MIRRKLAWRLYALGLLQIVLVAAAVVLGAVLNGPPRFSHDPEREIALAAARLGPLLARTRREDLAAEIMDLRKRGMLASVYDALGDLVASNVHPPLERAPMGVDPPRAEPLDPKAPPPGPHSSPPPLPLPRTRAFPFRGFPLEQAVTVALGDETAGGSRGILVVRFERPTLDLKAPLLTLCAGLLIVGVGALLMARWLVRPLQQLAKAAYAFGEGDLRARSGLLRTDEVGDVGRAFDRMAERVERLLHAEKELLANVSHELRTPLARIRVALDLAQEGDAPAAKEALSEIEVDLGELESLLDDVLTTARMEIEGGRVSPASFALHVEVLSTQLVGQRVSERFRARHPNRPLEVYLGGGLHPVLADPVLLRRALDNLLENAHKYSPDSTSAIELGVRARRDRVDFEVRDHGMGILPADLTHVFDPFFRGEKSRSRGTGGVGLGLTLAKRIIEAHGGTIHVTSMLGTGTTVHVELPAAERAKEASVAERRA